MRNKQIDLLFKVLLSLQEKGILKHFILAGSWCMYFYRFYFHKRNPITSLRTRDVDFFVPNPKSIGTKVDLPVLLKSFGFVIDYRGRQGFIRLMHPEFFVEFLVQEKGKGIEKAVSLPKLGLNAQAHRFLDILYLDTITLSVKGTKIKLPHPACFVLHKILIFTRRPKKEKREKDVKQINIMLDLLRKENKLNSLKKTFIKLHPKWKQKVINNLKLLGKDEIIDILQ